MSDVALRHNEAVKLYIDLERTGAATATALVLNDPNMKYETAEALATFLGAVNRRCAWHIGDLLLYTERLFGERYAQIGEATGLSPTTLANRVSVCKHIPPSRRRASVPFSTHAEVAYLEPEDQERWLDEAEAGRWTRGELRAVMRNGDEDEFKTGVLPPEPVERVCPSCGVVAPEDSFHKV